MANKKRVATSGNVKVLEGYGVFGIKITVVDTDEEWGKHAWMVLHNEGNPSASPAPSLTP